MGSGCIAPPGDPGSTCSAKRATTPVADEVPVADSVGEPTGLGLQRAVISVAVESHHPTPPPCPAELLADATVLARSRVSGRPDLIHCLCPRSALRQVVPHRVVVAPLVVASSRPVKITTIVPVQSRSDPSVTRRPELGLISSHSDVTGQQVGYAILSAIRLVVCHPVNLPKGLPYRAKGQTRRNRCPQS